MLPLLAGCETRLILHGFETNYQAVATFKIPKGWVAIDKKNNTIGRFTIGRKHEPVGGIDILYSRLDPTQAPTDEGQVQGYLYAVHHHTDENVVCEKYSEATNSFSESIPIYYMHSDYFGDRLFCEYVKGDLGISAEYCAPSEKALKSVLPSYSELISSFQIHK